MDWDHNSEPPDQLVVNGTLVTKAFDIASEMNNFFIQKVKLIQESVHFIPNDYRECRKIMKDKVCKLDLRYVAIKQVNSMLKKLKNSKCCSIDG